MEKIHPFLPGEQDLANCKDAGKFRGSIPISVFLRIPLAYYLNAASARAALHLPAAGRSSANATIAGFRFYAYTMPPKTVFKD